MRTIGLVGYAGVGKDTVGNILCDNFNQSYSRFAFADELKSELEDFIWDKFKINIFSCSREEKEKVRDLLVFWGVKRRSQNPNYWLNKVMSKINDSDNYYNVVTDVRYANEARAIQSCQLGEVWLLQRENIQPACQEEADSVSEVKEIADRILNLPNVSNLEDLNPIILKEICSF